MEENVEELGAGRPRRRAVRGGRLSSLLLKEMPLAVYQSRA